MPTMTHFGWSVSLSNKYAVVGEPYNDLVYIYELPTFFAIMNIADVPNDQGKNVRVSWYKNPYDGIQTGDSSVVEYSLWRRIDELPVEKESIAKMNYDFDASHHLMNITNETLPPGEWDFVMVIPASGIYFYHFVTKEFHGAKKMLLLH